MNRDTFIELWKVDPVTEALTLISTYKIRGQIKSIKVVYSPLLEKDLLFVLIKDVKLIVLKYDPLLAEMAKLGMYNFELYQELSGKITQTKEENNLLSVFVHQRSSYVSLLIADQWIAMIELRKDIALPEFEDVRKSIVFSKSYSYF